MPWRTWRPSAPSWQRWRWTRPNRRRWRAAPPRGPGRALCTWWWRRHVPPRPRATAMPPSWPQCRRRCCSLSGTAGGCSSFFLDLIHSFVEGSAHHLPVKKLVLLMWKCAAVMHGSLSEVPHMKNALRETAGLPPCDPPRPADLVPESGLVVAEPAAAKIDRLAKARPGGLQVVPDTDDDDGEATETEEGGDEGEGPDGPDTDRVEGGADDGPTAELVDGADGDGDTDDDVFRDRPALKARSQSEAMVLSMEERSEAKQPSRGSLRRRPGPPGPPPSVKARQTPPKPPKVSPAYLETFRQQLDARKFATMYYDPKTDSYRHPPAIDEATRTLEAALYTSFRHVDMQAERKRQETQLAHGLSYLPGAGVGALGRVPSLEALFTNVVQSWSEYAIDLVRLLFAGTTLNASGKEGSSKASMSFEAELWSADPAAAGPTTPLQIAMVHEAHARHGGIITKAVASLLLLLIKLFRLNHTFQAEHIANKLFDAKCVIVAIKALNRPDVVDHFCRSLDRSDVLGILVPAMPPAADLAGATLSADGLDGGAEGSLEAAAGAADDEAGGAAARSAVTLRMRRGGTEADDGGEPGTNHSAPARSDGERTVTNRRHLQAALALLRLLQKMTKGKQHCVVQLVHSKSIEILKPLLRLKHGATQLYALKLIKSQVPYFNRQWRKSNQRILSSIDLKVRHHILDPWFYTQIEDTEEGAPKDEGSKEVSREAVARYVQEYYPADPDALAGMLRASCIFDLYQPLEQ
mmetsp:Transcript_23836/g.71118  ORF Transcript_23836/g.71118 Transcript_23836/m.71118 type:complete len:751 (+) Transcript_23836:398-2650(+)